MGEVVVAAIERWGKEEKHKLYKSQEIYIPKRSPGIDKIKTKYKLLLFIASSNPTTIRKRQI